MSTAIRIVVIFEKAVSVCFATLLLLILIDLFLLEEVILGILELEEGAFRRILRYRSLCVLVPRWRLGLLVHQIFEFNTIVIFPRLTIFRYCHIVAVTGHASSGRTRDEGRVLVVRVQVGSVLVVRVRFLWNVLRRGR